MGRSSTGGPARRRPGELESEILAALWKAAEPMSPGQVQAAMGGELAYATVSTILGRLHDKGLVTRTTVGRTHHYVPTIDQSAYVSDQVRRLLEHGDRSAVLQGFLAELTPADERLLLRMLDDENPAGEGPAGEGRDREGRGGG
jgi:predicted transcriptional regulator